MKFIDTLFNSYFSLILFPTFFLFYRSLSHSLCFSPCHYRMVLFRTIISYCVIGMVAAVNFRGQGIRGKRLTVAFGAELRFSNRTT